MPSLPKDPVKGKPVRADWGRRLLEYLRSFPLRGGPGIQIQKTGNGWTISAKPDRTTRPPKLWHVTLDDLDLDPFSIAAKVIEETLDALVGAMPSEGDFAAIFDSIFSGLTRESGGGGSVAAAIEALFAALKTAIEQMESILEGILNDIAPIADTLSAYFEDQKKLPQDGDYIYTDEIGIVYILFRQRVSEESEATIPTQNLIFRVEFDISFPPGEPVTYVAMTTFPAPDLFRLLDTLFDFMITLVSKVLAAGLSALMVGVLTGVLSGLNALFDELEALINALVDALWDAINALTGFDPTDLWNAIQDLTDGLDALRDRVDVLETAQDALQTALDALEAVIEDSVEVTVIGADGSYHTIKVQEDASGASAEREITWINSSQGYGERASFLVKQDAAAPTSNIEDVDWRQVNYIHPDGTTYQMHCLVRVANENSSFGGYLGEEPVDHQSSNNLVIEQLVICDRATNTAKEVKGYFHDGHGAMASENGADPDFYTPPA